MQKVVLISFVSLLLMGCATMNKSQCYNADWHMIGMEDGMKGRLIDYIGKHRVACAKYNVTPDLEEYRQGRAEGLEQFCTRSNGFNTGLSGYGYNGVCPAQLAEPFLEGFAQGQDLYFRYNAIQKVSSQIQSEHRRIEKIDNEISEKKQKLLSDKASKSDRALLLREIEDLQDKTRDVEKNIRRLKSSKAKMEMEIEQLRN